MRYIFPATKFVDENTVEEQIEHVKSEFVEFVREIEKGKMGMADLEAMDLYHSLETYFRIREKLKQISVDATREWVQRKNEIRGYYNNGFNTNNNNCT